MNREKLISISVGSGVILFVCYLMLNAMLLSPLKTIGKNIREVESDISSKEQRLNNFSARARRLTKLAENTFGSDPSYASEQILARIVEVVQLSGLDSRSMTIKPFSGTGKKDYYREVGWSLTVPGSLPKIINLLYLLQEEPYLHRVENLSLAPGKDGQVELKLNYQSLVLPPARNKKAFEPGTFVSTAEAADLGSDSRRAYDAIITRDLFRPYKRHVPPPPPPRPTPSPPARMSTPTPPVQRLVGLPAWGSPSEVQLLDPRSGKVTTLTVGDPLIEGRIEMVDYREMTYGNDPQVFSPSRVIVSVDGEYWAVDLGQDLSAKRKLTQDELPENLKNLKNAN